MKTLSMFILLTTILLGCSESDSISEKKREDIPLTKSEQEMVDAGNLFAFDLFKRVYAEEKESPNLFISPLSAGMALGMTVNGSAGETEKGMLKTLGFEGSSTEAINTYYNKMYHALLNIDPSTTLGIANSIWLKEGFPILPDFVSVNKEMYQAEVQSRDFSDPATLAAINNWCASKTDNRIPKILKEIPVDARVYLINAIYFMGTWKYGFDKKNTKEQPFRAEDGSTASVEMMAGGKMTLNYMENNSYQLLELPYGNEAFSMMVLLPKADQSIQEVAQLLNADEWYASLEAMQIRLVDVKLPCFKFDYENDLIKELSDMGMDMAFDRNRADFAKINPTVQLFISKVLQKTFVEVNEKGTEAAAATVVEVAQYTTSPSSTPNIQFIADHPFLFAIKEKSTGCILFIGKVGKLI